MPLISICIPAYKNKEFLARLLNSIAIQTFKDFEVVVSDDSPTNELESICNKYANTFVIRYYRNTIPLGTPNNWNFAISKASGKWIKLMHHDDWFAESNSLKIFADSALNSMSDFIFSGYIEVENSNHKDVYILSTTEKALLKKSALNLFKKNFIGHPSTTLIRNNKQKWYDEKVKWVVDFEFYIRCLEQTQFLSIDNPLINIGIHENQVTKHVFRKPEIEIPENLYLINKIGAESLENIFVYDYYWRLFRNLNIRNIAEVLHFSNGNKVAPGIEKMLAFQFKIPLWILRIGIFSKSFMLLSKVIA